MDLMWITFSETLQSRKLEYKVKSKVDMVYFFENPNTFSYYTYYRLQKGQLNSLLETYRAEPDFKNTFVMVYSR